MRRFVINENNGTGQKRKQTPNACARCRKQKRKCRHHDDHSVDRTVQTAQNLINARITEGNALLSPRASHDSLGAPALEAGSEPTVSNGHITKPAFHTKRISFPYMGSTEPSMFLRSSVAPHIDTDAELRPSSEHRWNLRPSLQDFKFGEEIRPGHPPNMPMVVRAVLPFLETEVLSVLPPQAHCEKLLHIYTVRIHPLLPIVDLGIFQMEGLTSWARINLLQAICLVASKDCSAKTHLVLPTSPAPLDHRAFADRLFAALKLSLDIGLVQDRLILIQVLALMTFHSYGPDGNDEIARICGQAVHYTFSCGLHVLPPRPTLHDTQSKALCCCVWVLDKLTALITGRPFWMDERDIGFSLKLTCQEQGPGFRVLSHVVRLLKNVMDLRQPGFREKSRASKRKIISFENVVLLEHAECIDENLLGMLSGHYDIVY